MIIIISVLAQNTTFQVTSLTPNQEYVFRVSVANTHGFSEPGQMSELVVTIDGRNTKLGNECA